jgi:DNA-binding GntR family transcriptional regulator
MKSEDPMKFSASKNLSDQIADYLIDEVVKLGILPGERLLEQKISQDLGVSRSPVREAFRVLEQTGLVELIPRCGARVTAITEERIEAYCDMFILVLGHVVRRCVENYRPEHLETLTHHYRQMEIHAEQDDYKQFYEALLRCLEIGITATDNPALDQVVKSIMPYLKRLQYIAIVLKTDSLKDNFLYFKDILESLIERDVSKGVRAITEYIEHEKNITLDAVKKSRLADFLKKKE